MNSEIIKSFKVEAREHTADIHTPVSIYLKIRDLSSQSILLESSDFHSASNSRSFIAYEPIASISITDFKVVFSCGGKEYRRACIDENYGVDCAIEQFKSDFKVDGDFGFFGYTAYDSVKYFENIAVEPNSPKDNDAPDLYYVLFRYVVEFDHFHSRLNIKEIVEDGAENSIDKVVSAIERRNFSEYGFFAEGEVKSTITDSEYIEMVKKGREHTYLGDVFQIVLSRRFIQKFKGDDFAVYRTLRSINPSPYLFYFDFGGVKIFGSSPETHCKVENGRLSIDPIAGTAFRTGDLVEDAALAEALQNDPKESAEHVMLVDLARNDISRNAEGTEVEFYKETQYYSHVIHLVSRVSGKLRLDSSATKAFIDTFPAGTLSGAPKVKAMQLINEIEPHNRGIYGGAIGYIGFNGDFNHAITIRTFVSRNGQLEFQAGAGIVALSEPERELQEVKSKLAALSKAINTEARTM
ncbi:MAG: anthranilate synthase component I family protein [Rikenellaceae bacterium]